MISNALKVSNVRGLISLDLDGTLITPKYYFPPEKNTSELREVRVAIKKLRNMGFLICLNSARSAYALRKWQKFFATDEPNFCEFGGVLDYPTAKHLAIYDKETEKLTKKLRLEFIKTLGRHLTKKGYENVEILLCRDIEPEEEIKKARVMRKWTSGKKSYGVYINGMNKLRLGLRAFRKSGKGAVPDGEFFNHVFAHLRLLAAKKHPRKFHFLIYPETSVIVAYKGKQNKTKPLVLYANYLKRIDKNIEIYHIGNGKDDIIKNKNIRIWAVANSDNKLADAAEAVSRHPYTRGVVDFLKRILISAQSARE